MTTRCGRTLYFLLALATTACAGPVRADGSHTAPPTSAYIIGRIGVEMTEAAARHGIAFQPFAPPRRVVDVALLPPFHGADRRANRGIAFEYVGSSAHRYALAEWPANGGTIERFPLLANNETGCTGVRTFRRGNGPDGIVWSTPRGLILTLQADGVNDARTLGTEWRGLIRRGVCR